MHDRFSPSQFSGLSEGDLSFAGGFLSINGWKRIGMAIVAGESLGCYQATEAGCREEQVEIVSSRSAVEKQVPFIEKRVFMKRILVRSVFDTFDYVMQHYYPAGLEEMAERSDTYAVISIQDTHTGGFGVTFEESQFCKGVLTLYFDDIVREVDGAVLFSREMAREIIYFILGHKAVDTLIVHCYAGQSRSRAVGAFVVKMFGGDNSGYFMTGSPNRHVYDTLLDEWDRVQHFPGF